MNSCDAIAAVGTFDGVHQGHITLLDALRRQAADRGMRPLVVTFTSHPLATIAPERAPYMLTSLDEKLNRLRDCGVDVVAMTFDEHLRRLTANQWLTLLRDRYGVRAIMLGHDNTFGSDGQHMTHTQYAGMARQLGMETIEAPVLPAVSSSAVRHAVSEGRMDDAERMLGRPFAINGTVVHGRQLGRRLGFPTANLRTPPGIILPPTGVYAAMVEGADTQARPAVLNIGRRPTVENDGVIIPELHIPGLHRDLYGKTLTVSILRLMRGECKFPSTDTLRLAIAHDTQQALEIAAHRKKQ